MQRYHHNAFKYILKYIAIWREEEVYFPITYLLIHFVIHSYVVLRFSFRCAQGNESIKRISLVIANTPVSVKSSGPLLTVVISHNSRQ